MTTLNPLPAYTDEELKRLYPPHLELQLVQVLLRHGERTPVNPRFQNAGLHSHWAYCHAAERFRAAISTPHTSNGWTSLQWKRRLETFGENDQVQTAIGPGSEAEGVCQSGELTDKGRQTTHDLGTRLRRLYIDQLKFMPNKLESSDQMYLRSTPIARALESLQQAFTGMYPPPTLAPGFAPPTIVMRAHPDETLYPNEHSCKRFSQLARAFGKRTAEVWNNSPEMDYINKRLGKWMPESSPKVAVDSHPRLSGILDTTYSTLAHGPATRLPKEFYEQNLVDSIDKIVVEEWFAGYKENKEYRTLGIGALAGDIVERITKTVEGSGSVPEDQKLKFAMSGCHDTTVAALAIAFGGFQGEKWPSYTSHIAIELFKKKTDGTQSNIVNQPAAVVSQLPSTTSPGWFQSMLGQLWTTSTSTATSIGRRPYTELSSEQQSRLQDYYVRVRYNDRPLALTACRKQGNHLEGDESLCTLETFKKVVDEITPKNWKAACLSNLNKPIVGIDIEGPEPAGIYVET